MAAKNGSKLESKTMQLPRPDRRYLEIEVIGDSSLISHSWDPRTIEQIAGKQGGKAQNKKGPKDPQAEYCGSLYWLDANGRLCNPGDDPAKHKTGFGIPGAAFRKAMIEAGYQMGNEKKTKLRCPFRILQTYVRIQGRPRMSREMVRVGGKADIRYRAEFVEWSCRFRILYDHNVITDEQLVNLLDNAGFGVGVGDWRAEKNGTHGCFHVGQIIETMRRKK